MDAWLWSLFIGFGCFVTFNPSCQTQVKTGAKKLNVQRYDDYTFEGVLDRAKEECSYMSLVNDTVVRNRTLHAIKEKIARKKLQEFYEEKEREKKKAKEYYENVEKQSRRKVLEEPPAPGPRGAAPPGAPGWAPHFVPPRPFLPPPPPPLPPPPPPPPPPPSPGFLFRRHLYKRSTDWQGRRRKSSSSSSGVTFTDHNNCSSRCLFARMEMVDASGFPDESLITKLIEDKMTNKKTRLVKTKKVNSCFKKMEKVSFSDSCIFSSRLFDCLDLGESFAWSGP